MWFRMLDLDRNNSLYYAVMWHFSIYSNQIEVSQLNKTSYSQFFCKQWEYCLETRLKHVHNCCSTTKTSRCKQNIQKLKNGRIYLKQANKGSWWEGQMDVSIFIEKREFTAFETFEKDILNIWSWKFVLCWTRLKDKSDCANLPDLCSQFEA